MVSVNNIIIFIDIKVIIEEMFLVERLSIVMINFDGEDIIDYDETISALDGIGSYFFPQRSWTWT